MFANIIWSVTLLHRRGNPVFWKCVISAGLRFYSTCHEFFLFGFAPHENIGAAVAAFPTSIMGSRVSKYDPQHCLSCRLSFADRDSCTGVEIRNAVFAPAPRKNPRKSCPERAIAFQSTRVQRGVD